MIALTRTKLIAARARSDPIGIRPMVMGELDGKPIFCSETCALDIIGAKFVRDVENGEVIICEIQPGRIDHHRQPPPCPAPTGAPCLFELFISHDPFGRRRPQRLPDPQGHGDELAKEAPCDGDVVVPVPDGGTPAALGYAQASGIPFEYGIIRNHYVGRTFTSRRSRSAPLASS